MSLTRTAALVVRGPSSRGYSSVAGFALNTKKTLAPSSVVTRISPSLRRGRFSTAVQSATTSTTLPSVRVVEEESTTTESSGGRTPMMIKEVAVVSTLPEAKVAASALMESLEREPDRIHALDTEVADIDLSKVGPVGNGKMTCFTVYSGPDFDYGVAGASPGRALFVETTDDDILEVFRDWLESPARKVWHNYGFDRHIVANHGVVCGGFSADTMHMARLWDSTRAKSFGGGGKGYSLESLSEDLIPGDGTTKTPMKTLFAEYIKQDRKKVLEKAKAEEKDLSDIPPASQLPILGLQTNQETREDFICYAAYDAKSTWQVYHHLRKQLEEQEWVPQGDGDSGTRVNNMLVIYETYLVPFGKLLTDMEAAGIYVDKDGHLEDIEAMAKADKVKELKTFRTWAISKLGRRGGTFLNFKSTKQMQHFLFGGAELPRNNGEFLPTVLECDVGTLEDDTILPPSEDDTTPTVDGSNGGVTVSREVFYERATGPQLKAELVKRGLSSSGSKTALLDRLMKDDEMILRGGKETDGGSDDGNTGVTTTSDRGSNQNDDATLLSEFDLEMCYTGAVKKEKDRPKRSYTIPELKKIIRAYNDVVLSNSADTRLSLSGKKKDLVERLREVEGSIKKWKAEQVNIPVESQHDAEIPVVEKDLYDDMTYNQLCGQIKARCQIPPKTQAECVQWLRNDDEFCWELQKDDVEESRSDLSSPVKKPELTSEPEDAKVAAAIEMSSSPTSSSSSSKAASISYTLPAKQKKETITIQTLGLKPKVFTPSGLPAISSVVIKELAGDPPEKPGTAVGTIGVEGCMALSSLNRMSVIDKMLGTFIQPLRDLADIDSRVHCSLNLNTETGRLSSRCPNLQNQPALEKDTYRIRHAFRAPKGKKLIVADYGQLELRVLAAITNCESMLTAFREGGCFHSRTAVGMFEHVRKAVESGEVLLEKGKDNDEDKPLVKDVFAAERRKAKTMNFSIAYGKSSYGFMKDFDIGRKQAEDLVNAWYGDRNEVLRWQQQQQEFAKKEGYVTTLLGRRRYIPELRDNSKKLRGAGGRAAINTPIQGSAADIVMMAMIKLHSSEVLAKLGWRLLLQIHDEVILEGPEETAQEAFDEVKQCMEHPYDSIGLKPLAVDLPVDGNIADTWYEAK